MNEFEDPIFSEVTRYDVEALGSPDAEIQRIPDDITYLDCEDTQLSSFAPIQRLKRLRILNISNTRIEDLDGISQLKALEVLFADFGCFTSLQPLADLPFLRSLDITCSQASSLDISPLRYLDRLERLYLAHSPIGSIDPIMSLGNLRLLSVAGTEVPSGQIQQFMELHPECEVWK